MLSSKAQGSKQIVLQHKERENGRKLASHNVQKRKVKSPTVVDHVQPVPVKPVQALHSTTTAKAMTHRKTNSDLNQDQVFFNNAGPSPREAIATFKKPTPIAGTLSQDPIVEINQPRKRLGSAGTRQNKTIKAKNSMERRLDANARLKQKTDTLNMQVTSSSLNFRKTETTIASPKQYMLTSARVPTYSGPDQLSSSVQNWNSFGSNQIDFQQQNPLTQIDSGCDTIQAHSKTQSNFKRLRSDNKVRGGHRRKPSAPIASSSSKIKGAIHAWNETKASFIEALQENEMAERHKHEARMFDFYRQSLKSNSNQLRPNQFHNRYLAFSGQAAETHKKSKSKLKRGPNLRNSEIIAPQQNQPVVNQSYSRQSVPIQPEEEVLLMKPHSTKQFTDLLAIAKHDQDNSQPQIQTISQGQFLSPLNKSKRDSILVSDDGTRMTPAKNRLRTSSQKLQDFQKKYKSQQNQGNPQNVGEVFSFVSSSDQSDQNLNQRDTNQLPYLAQDGQYLMPHRSSWRFANSSSSGDRSCGSTSMPSTRLDRILLERLAKQQRSNLFGDRSRDAIGVQQTYQKLAGTSRQRPQSHRQTYQAGNHCFVGSTIGHVVINNCCNGHQCSHQKIQVQQQQRQSTNISEKSPLSHPQAQQKTQPRNQDAPQIQIVREGPQKKVAQRAQTSKSMTFKKVTVKRDSAPKQSLPKQPAPSTKKVIVEKSFKKVGQRRSLGEKGPVEKQRSNSLNDLKNESRQDDQLLLKPGRGSNLNDNTRNKHDLTIEDIDHSVQASNNEKASNPINTQSSSGQTKQNGLVNSLGVVKVSRFSMGSRTSYEQSMRSAGPKEQTCEIELSRQLSERSVRSVNIDSKSPHMTKEKKTMTGACNDNQQSDHCHLSVKMKGVKVAESQDSKRLSGSGLSHSHSLSSRKQHYRLLDKSQCSDRSISSFAKTDKLSKSSNKSNLKKNKIKTNPLSFEVDEQSEITKSVTIKFFNEMQELIKKGQEQDTQKQQALLSQFESQIDNLVKARIHENTSQSSKQRSTHHPKQKMVKEFSASKTFKTERKAEVRFENDSMMKSEMPRKSSKLRRGNSDNTGIPTVISSTGDKRFQTKKTVTSKKMPKLQTQKANINRRKTMFAAQISSGTNLFPKASSKPAEKSNSPQPKNMSILRAHTQNPSILNEIANERQSIGDDEILSLSSLLLNKNTFGPFNANMTDRETILEEEQDPFDEAKDFINTVIKEPTAQFKHRQFSFEEGGSDEKIDFIYDEDSPSSDFNTSGSSEYEHNSTNSSGEGESPNKRSGFAKVKPLPGAMFPTISMFTTKSKREDQKECVKRIKTVQTLIAENMSQYEKCNMIISDCMPKDKINLDHFEDEDLDNIVKIQAQITSKDKRDKFAGKNGDLPTIPEEVSSGIFGDETVAAMNLQFSSSMMNETMKAPSLSGMKNRRCKSESEPETCMEIRTLKTLSGSMLQNEQKFFEREELLAKKAKFIRIQAQAAQEEVTNHINRKLMEVQQNLGSFTLQDPFGRLSIIQNGEPAVPEKTQQLSQDQQLKVKNRLLQDQHQVSLNLPENVFLVPALATKYFLQPGKGSDYSKVRDLGSPNLIREMEQQGITDFDFDHLYNNLVTVEMRRFSAKIDMFIRSEGIDCELDTRLSSESSFEKTTFDERSLGIKKIANQFDYLKNKLYKSHRSRAAGLPRTPIRKHLLPGFNEFLKQVKDVSLFDKSAQRICLDQAQNVRDRSSAQERIDHQMHVLVRDNEDGLQLNAMENYQMVRNLFQIEPVSYFLINSVQKNKNKLQHKLRDKTKGEVFNQLKDKAKYSASMAAYNNQKERVKQTQANQNDLESDSSEDEDDIYQYIRMAAFRGHNNSKVEQTDKLNPFTLNNMDIGASSSRSTNNYSLDQRSFKIMPSMVKKLRRRSQNLSELLIESFGMHVQMCKVKGVEALMEIFEPVCIRQTKSHKRAEFRLSKKTQMLPNHVSSPLMIQKGMRKNHSLYNAAHNINSQGLIGGKNFGDSVRRKTLNQGDPRQLTAFMGQANKEFDTDDSLRELEFEDVIDFYTKNEEYEAREANKNEEFKNPGSPINKNKIRRLATIKIQRDQVGNNKAQAVLLSSLKTAEMHYGEALEFSVQEAPEPKGKGLQVVTEQLAVKPNGLNNNMQDRINRFKNNEVIDFVEKVTIQAEADNRKERKEKELFKDNLPNPPQVEEASNDSKSRSYSLSVSNYQQQTASEITVFSFNPWMRRIIGGSTKQILGQRKTSDAVLVSNAIERSMTLKDKLEGEKDTADNLKDEIKVNKAPAEVESNGQFLQPLEVPFMQKKSSSLRPSLDKKKQVACDEQEKSKADLTDSLTHQLSESSFREGASSTQNKVDVARISAQECSDDDQSDSDSGSDHESTSEDPTFTSQNEEESQSIPESLNSQFETQKDDDSEYDDDHSSQQEDDNIKLDDDSFDRESQDVVESLPQSQSPEKKVNLINVPMRSSQLTLMSVENQAEKTKTFKVRLLRPGPIKMEKQTSKKDEKIMFVPRRQIVSGLPQKRHNQAQQDKQGVENEDEAKTGNHMKQQRKMFTQLVAMLMDTAVNSDFIQETIQQYTGNFDIPTDSNGTTLLILAVRSNRMDVCELLLMKCADVNKADLEGNTPLHHAFMMGFSSLIHCLIENGATESIENAEGKLPWELRI